MHNQIQVVPKTRWLYTVPRYLQKSYLKLKPQSITYLEKNKYGWSSLLGQLTKTKDSKLQYLHLMLRVRVPTSAPPQELLDIFFFPYQTRSYLRAGTEPYFLLVSQYKPLETPAKTRLINKFINLILFPEYKFLQQHGHAFCLDTSSDKRLIFLMRLIFF